MRQHCTLNVFLTNNLTFKQVNDAKYVIYSIQFQHSGTFIGFTNCLLDTWNGVLKSTESVWAGSKLHDAVKVYLNTSDDTPDFLILGIADKLIDAIELTGIAQHFYRPNLHNDYGVNRLDRSHPFVEISEDTSWPVVVCAFNPSENGIRRTFILPMKTQISQH